MGRFRAATAGWLVALAAFEAVAIAQWAAGAPLSDIMPVLAGSPPSELAGALSAAFAAALAILRLAAAADTANLGLWRAVAGVHVAEAGFFAHQFAVAQPRAAVARGVAYPSPAGAGVFGCILLNAAWFTAAWWVLPGGKAKRA